MSQVRTEGLGSRALRNTAVVLAARVLSRLLALVTVLATLNHLGDAGFGRFQTLVNYTALVAVLVDLGFNTLYIREGARHPAQIERYLNNLLSVKALFSAVALVVLAALLRLRNFQDLLLPGFVLMVLTSYSNLLRGTFYALQRLGYEAIAIVLESLLLLGLVLAGIFTHQGVAYFIWSYAASYAFSCVYFLAVLLLNNLVRIRWRLEPAFVRRWFWSGLPFALTFVLTTLYFRIDVPILQLFRSDAEVGWYSAAYKPFEALLFLPMTMLQVVFPVLSVYHKDSPDRVAAATARFFKSLAMLGWPVTVGTYLLAPELTHVFRLFQQSEAALRILSIGIVFMFVNNAFIAALNSIDRQALFTWAALGSLVVNVILNGVLIPLYGYIGASYATVLTEVALGVICWVLVARELKPLPVLALSWRVLAAGAVMGVVVWLFRDFGGVGVLVPIAAGAAVYLPLVFLFRIIDREEMAIARRALRRGT